MVEVKFGGYLSTFGRLLHIKFHPIAAGIWCGTKKLHILRNLRIKLPTRKYSLRDFCENFSVCGEYNVRLTVKIWVFAHGVRSYYNFTSWVKFPQISEAPSLLVIDEQNTRLEGRFSVRPCAVYT